MSQSLHVHVLVNVLHSSTTHWIQVLTFIPFLDLGLIIQIIITWLLPSPKLGPRWALVFKTAELWGLEGMFPALSIKRGRGVC